MVISVSSPSKKAIGSMLPTPGVLAGMTLMIALSGIRIFAEVFRRNVG